ncbi:MAG: O-antigen ligase [Gammaproteobacteria bacterium]
MIDYIRNNTQVLLTLIVWTICGMFFWQSLLLLIPMTIVLFLKQDMYIEIFIGFWFILILSDSFLPALKFAKNMKVIYMLLLALMVFTRRHDLIKGKNPILTMFLPFFLLAFISILKSPEPIISFQKTLSYFLLFLIIPILVNYFIKLNEREFYRKIVFFGTFLLLVGLLFKYTGADWVYLAGRFRGLLGNPNGLGLFSALIFIIFQVVAFLRPDCFNKNEKITIIAIILFNVILCQSRTALFMIFIYLLFSRLYRISPLIGFVVLVVSLAAYQTIFSFLPEIIAALELEEFMRIETLESGSGRYIAWEFAWKNIKEHFFFGNGFSYTEYIFKENYYILSRLGHEGNAHNSYLTIWLDTGLTGLVTFVTPLVVLILSASKKTSVAMPFFFAVMFSTYFESWLTASLNPFTIVFLVVLSIITSSERSTETDLSPINLETSIAS